MTNKNIAVILPILAGLAMIVSQYFIWVYAPLEETMGRVQKIFYFHLPLAWWALIAFAGVFGSSIAYLIKKDKKWDLLGATLAELGVLFSALALLTGSIWGRAAWNTWWTWDPRLTTTLIMWFVYCGYLVLRISDVGGPKKEMILAVFGIIAFLDVPLVFLSARLWRSIHPAVFASKGGGLEPEMWTTVMVCLAAWGLLFLCLAFYRWAVLRTQLRVDRLAQRFF